MATTFRWSAYATIATYLSTTLNTLADAGNKTGATIDNSSNRHFYMDVEVSLASVDLSAGSNCAIDLYVLPSLDGTNFADGSDTVDPSTNNLVCSVPILASNAPHREIGRGIIIPPGLFKLLAENSTGKTLAGSGNTVKYRTYTEESA